MVLTKVKKSEITVKTVKIPCLVIDFYFYILVINLDFLRPKEIRSYLRVALYLCRLKLEELLLIMKYEPLMSPV